MQIAWEYIYSFPFPAVAKTLAADTGNATAVNTFYSSMGYLATPNGTDVPAPSRDLVTSNAFLDLSQVMPVSCCLCLVAAEAGSLIVRIKRPCVNSYC